MTSKDFDLSASKHQNVSNNSPKFTDEFNRQKKGLDLGVYKYYLFRRQKKMLQK